MEYLTLLEELKDVNTFGYLAALLTTFAFFPQLIKTWKNKSAEDVSLIMLISFITGVFLWIIYGWESHSQPVVIANIITLILNLMILFLKLKYKKS
tara:strand:+ start:231 stop:518 length:288 start_codon:yes stop_codon:yes gene_type:complete